MGTFRIQGGQKLKGEIQPQGAKNEALQVICATLLTAEEVTITNIPNIRDINKLIDLLADLGVSVNQLNDSDYTFCAQTVNIDYMKSPEYKVKAAGLRGSVMILGPLLSRFGEGYMPRPGGDKIGRRRLDTHFVGF